MTQDMDAPNPASSQQSYAAPANETMAQAGARILGDRLRVIRGYEAAVRRSEREAVHDMRVSVRRLRAVYSLFRRFYDPGDRSGLRAGLRRLGRFLGEVRDMEVLLADCAQAVSRLPDADLAGFEARLDERRAVARVRLLSYLDSDDYQRLHERFQRLIQRYQTDEGLSRARVAGDSGRVSRETVPAVMPERIWRYYGLVRAYEPLLPALPNRSLHGLRIAGKRLRYTIEAFQDSMGGDPQLLLGPLKTLQDELGALHDALVLSDLLHEFQSKAGPSDRLGPYLDEQRLREGEGRARFERVWPRLIDLDFRTRLAQAVAAL
jgi:CHAD domain-containing protein